MDESLALLGEAAAGRDRPVGEIHLIVGPMFAGKTTALLRRIISEADLGKYAFFFFYQLSVIKFQSFFMGFRHDDASRNVAMVKSSKDTRYATDAVVTHDGMWFPCWALPDLSSFKRRIGSNAYGKVRFS